MSVELASESGGMIGQFASSGGFAELVSDVDEYGTADLQSFFSRGFTQDTEGCAKSLRKLATHKSLAEGVADTALNLADMLEKEDFAIITDGTSDDQEE